MNRKEVLKELNELSPILAKIQEGDNLDVPEGYFSKLEDRIISRMQEDSKQGAEVIFLRPRYLYRVAAAVTAFVVVSVAFLTSRMGNSDTHFINTVEASSTLDYIINHPYEMDEEFLYESELFDDIDFAPIGIAESENIESYLNENIQDFELSYFNE